MPTEQLALDLWAPTRQAYVDRHQIGQIRLPWDLAAAERPGDPAPRAGELVPAWRCCRCGGIELTRYWLEREHTCCEDSWMPPCLNPPGRPLHPYRMDAHWIPPVGWIADTHRIAA